MMKYLLFLLFTTVSLASPQIVGGSRVVDPEGEAPFFMRVGNDCGGSIISQKYVLTAAHCVAYALKAPEKLILKNTRGETFSTKRIIVHPDHKYKNGIILYDFALIEIQEIMSASMIIAIDERAPVEGQELTAYGFGVYDVKRPAYSPYLKKIIEEFIPREVANREESYNGQISEDMIAAGHPDGIESTCQGDSGGPLVSHSSDEAKLVGVVSWGEGCGVPLKYSIYGDALHIKGWVDSQI